MGGLPLGKYVLPADDTIRPESASGLFALSNIRSLTTVDRPIYGDLMLDLETLDTETTSAIVSIGATKFRLDTTDDLNTILEDERNFYAILDTDDQLARGATRSEDTDKWWSEQSAEAQAVLYAEAEDSYNGLKRFLEFCKGIKRIWGNGNMFDNAIVRNACKNYDLEYPVFFSNDLDMRTFKYVWNLLTHWKSNVKHLRVGTTHNALHDAQSQVLQMQQMYKELKGSKYNGV